MQDDSHSQVLQAAVRHKRNGQLAVALAHFQDALRATPDAAWILCEIAECLNGLGRHRRALLACHDAIARDATRAMAWFHSGFAHQMLGQPAEALRCYLEAVRRDPANVAAHARLANLHVLQGRFDEARAFASHALAIEAGDATARLALARADIAEGQLDAAEALLIRLAGQTDANLKAIALSLLGDVRDAQDRTVEAFQAYCAAGRLSQDACRGRVARGPETASEQMRRVGAALARLPAGDGSALPQ